MLLKSLETNTAESPLLIKTPEPTTATQKTIFIQNIDEECHPIPGSFIEFVIENNTDLNNLFPKKGEYLTLLSKPNYGITSFKQLIDGERYKFKSYYEQSFIDELCWQQNEDKAMEQETYLAMKQFLATHLGPSVEDMPTNIMASDGKTIVQEWDAIFKDGNVLYLCEAKHNMTFEHITKFPGRIRKFKEFQANAQPEFRNITKHVGVLCGTLFPDLVQNCAHNHGFFCVYPSGHHYNVKNPDDFIIAC
ncbi:hypothetical protein HMI56_002107 [Coelomomyces lativittatus]|nr:hypothetical protein HMI56_002107 [Coelomomyces lativittatus]